MAAPILTQAEVRRYIAMPKHVPHENWKGKWKMREGRDLTEKVIARPDDENEDCEFQIEREIKPSREEVSISIGVKIPGRGQSIPLCRYDIQVLPHRCPKWFSPKSVDSRIPHKHEYNVRAVKEGMPSDWDKCAVPLNIKAKSPEQLVYLLLEAFRVDMNIEFHGKPGDSPFLPQFKHG